MIKPLCKIKLDLDEDEERADDSQEKKNQFVVIREKKNNKTLGGFEGSLVSRTSGMGEGKEK